MRPRYMGRTMNTYPVSESEMENISSLSGQTTVRFSIASLLLGLAGSIWINAIFYTEWTPAGQLAAHYIAPLLLLFSIGYAIGGFFARNKRASAWERIKNESIPVQTVVPTPEMVVRADGIR
jgi:hypothetical protein